MKRVRTALDSGILASCRFGQEQTSLASIQVLRLVLSRYIIAKA